MIAAVDDVPTTRKERVEKAANEKKKMIHMVTVLQESWKQDEGGGRNVR